MMTIAKFFKEEEDFLYRLGQEKGIEKGIQTGIKTGIERGEHKKAIEMAIKLKSKDVSVGEIAELTGLTIKEIQSLQRH